MLSGTCRGGPYDGKPLHHPEPRLYCFFRNRKGITYTMPTGGPKALPDDVKVAAYEWDADEKVWQWTREV